MVRLILRCPNCHRILENNVSYCKYCGAKLEVLENDEDDELIEDFLILELTDEDEEIEE